MYILESRQRPSAKQNVGVQRKGLKKVLGFLLGCGRNEEVLRLVSIPN